MEEKESKEREGYRIMNERKEILKGLENNRIMTVRKKERKIEIK